MMATGVLGRMTFMMGFASLAACRADNPTSPQAPLDAGPVPPGSQTAQGTLAVSIRDNSLAMGAASPPVAGAWVALDMPSGERVEIQTDSAGTATFAGIDWAGGVAQVTAYVAGYSLSTIPINADLDDAGATKTMTQYLYRRGGTPSERVLISGAITNPLDTGDQFNVTSSTGGAYTARGLNYSLSVPKGKATSIIASECGGWDASGNSRGIGQSCPRWSRLDVPALSEDTVANIDFAQNALTAITVNATIEITGGRSGHFGMDSCCSLSVTTVESGATMFLGTTSFSDVAADGSSFRHTGIYVASPNPEDHVQSRYIIRRVSASVEYTMIIVPGVPVDGTDVAGFLDPETLTPGPSFADPIGIAPGTVDGIVEILQLLDSSKRDLLWNVRLSKRATSFRFPTLPSAASRKDALGAGVLYAIAFSEHVDDSGQADKLAASDYVVIPSP